MITETFLKLCLQVLFGVPDNTLEIMDKYMTTVLQIKEIVNIYKKIQEEKGEEIPINLVEMVNFIGYSARRIIENKSVDRMLLIDSFNLSEGLTEYIKFVISNKLDSARLIQYLKHINYKYKLFVIVSNKSVFEDVINRIETGKYETVEQAVYDFETSINNLYYETMLNKQKILSEDEIISQKNFPLEFVNTKEEIERLLEEYVKFKSNKIKSLPSGFRTFDEHFSDGGFDAGRIYILAGVSGTGKSLWLLSSCIKSARLMNERLKETKEKLVYIFITAENQIFETLLRLSTMCTNKSEKELIPFLEQYKNKISNYLYMENVRTEFKYVSPYYTSVSDIIVLIERILDKYRKLSEEEGVNYRLAALYIDYLDLFKPIKSTDLYRLELGHLTMELKELSIRYMIPVITLTQVNDYNIEQLCNDRYVAPRLDLLTESKKKIENADCVMIIHTNKYLSRKFFARKFARDLTNIDKLLEDERIISISITKNRGYKKGAFNAYIDYNKRKIYTLSRDMDDLVLNEYPELTDYKDKDVLRYIKAPQFEIELTNKKDNKSKKEENKCSNIITSESGVLF